MATGRSGRRAGDASGSRASSPTPASRKADQLRSKASRKAEQVSRRAEQVSRKAEQVSRQADRVSRRAERMAERVGRGGGRRPGGGAGAASRAELWTRDEPGRRQPRFSRDDIAAAALDILDTEGFDALSMRRLAAELGAGTMTLYHYVKTKDELLAIVGDAIMGELLLSDDELSDDWREALTAIAHHARDAIRRHPWMLEHFGAGVGGIGPNGARHFDQTMRAVSSLDVPFVDRLDIAGAVDEYVFGFCLMELDDIREGPVTDEIAGYVNSLVATGDYPGISAVIDELGGFEEAWKMFDQYSGDPDRFDRNLNRIFDGFELQLKRRSR